MTRRRVGTIETLGTIAPFRGSVAGVLSLMSLVSLLPERRAA